MLEIRAAWVAHPFLILPKGLERAVLMRGGGCWVRENAGARVGVRNISLGMCERRVLGDSEGRVAVIYRLSW